MRRGKFRPKTALDERFLWKVSLLRAFVDQHGTAAVQRDTIVPPGVKLGSWVVQCRIRQRADRMLAWQVKELESIPGWSWDPIGDRHRRSIALLRDLVAASVLGADALLVLGDWIIARRRDRAAGTIEPTVEAELHAISGWTWDSTERRKKPRYAPA